jgi:hypothetical protein
VPSPVINQEAVVSLIIGTEGDFRAFEIALERFSKSNPRQHLFDVLDTGPISPEDVGEFISVYNRGMLEVQRFLAAGVRKS